MVATNPYESPEAMAEHLVSSGRKLSSVLEYLRGCEDAHQKSNDADMANFWRLTRLIVEDRARAQGVV